MIKIRTLVAFAAIALTFAVAGCSNGVVEAERAPKQTPVQKVSPTHSPSPKSTHPTAKSTRSPSAASTPTPTTARNIAPDVVAWDEYDTAVSWRGGAIVKSVRGTGEQRFKIWTPLLSQPNECVLNPWLQGEVQSGAVDVMATTGDDSVVAIAYEARTPGTGLQGDVARAYVQLLDPKDCSLGPRIDLGVSVEAPNAVVGVKFISYAEGVLAVGAGFNAIGFSPRDGKLLWRIEEDLNVTRSVNYTEIGEDVFRIDTSVWDGVRKDALYRVTDGSVLIDDSNETPQFRLGWVGNYISKIGDTSILLGPEYGMLWAAGNVIPTDKYSRIRAPMVSQVKDGGWVAVAFAVYNDWSTVLIRIHSDGRLVELIDADKLALLDLGLHGVSGSYIYVSTTTEIVELDADGKETGRTWPRAELSSDLESLEGRLINGEIWTLWRWGIAGDQMAVSRAGVVPWD